MKFVELRVHGVSGTSPEALLGVEKVTQVAGDELVRFVHPADGGELTGNDPADKGQLEGMSWGKLTSGSVIQATWLLLLPFAFVNLAYWARTWDGESRWTSAYRWLVRVVGLALTAMLVFAVSVLSTNQLAWQCAIRDREDCFKLNGWLDATRSWTTGATLAAGATVPVLLMFFLWFLSHRATLKYEAYPSEVPIGTGDRDPDLFSRRLWRGELLVTRLRSLHLTVGIATATVILALPIEQLDGGAPRALAWVALIGSGLLMLGSIMFATPARGLVWVEKKGHEKDWIGPKFVASAMILFGLAVVAACMFDGTAPDTYRHVPGLIPVGHALAVVSVVAVAALLVICLIAFARGGIGATEEDTDEDTDEDTENDPADPRARVHRRPPRRDGSDHQLRVRGGSRGPGGTDLHRIRADRAVRHVHGRVRGTGGPSRCCCRRSGHGCLRDHPGVLRRRHVLQGEAAAGGLPGRDARRVSDRAPPKGSERTTSAEPPRGHR